MSLKKVSISERRAAYPLEHRLKSYSPQKMHQQLNDAASTKKLVLNGVNILNNRSVDCDTARDRLRQRRETHNKVERRRRDILNSLISELSDIVPFGTESKNKSQRAAVLRRTVQYVRWIQNENQNLRVQLNLPEQDHQTLHFDEDYNTSITEHSSHGSRSPSVESGANSDQAEEPILPVSPQAHSRTSSSGTFHTFSISSNDSIIGVNSG